MREVILVGVILGLPWSARAVSGEDDPEIGDTMEATIGLAEKAIQAAVPEAEKDAFRPGFHFRAPAQWMNDICGALYYRGYYHVWYQLNPFSDRVDWGHVHSCWGHARSRDLVHWEHMPISLAPSRADGDRQCASGCATFDGSDRPMLFYAYTPRGPRQQWAGVPLDDDLRRWKKLDVGLAPGRSGISADISL